MLKEQRRSYEKIAAAWTQETLIEMSRDDMKLFRLLLKLGVL
jgi:hypothetical protein